MLKIRQATGRTRVIPSAVIAGISQKSSEKSCNFNSYKYSGKWVEKKSQLLVKYQTLDKQLLSHSSQIKSTKMFDKEKR
jgi:putative transposase